MSFFKELKQRNVIKAVMLYLVGAWLILQITDVLTSLLSLPENMGPLVFTILVIGFVPVMILSWVFEITPEGLKREKDLDRSEDQEDSMSRRLIFSGTLIAIMVGSYFIAGLFVPETQRDAGVADGDSTEPLVIKTPDPNKPSIAVTEFQNLSADPEQSYFAAGMTEDIITKLTYVRGIRVISRSSTMRYKDQAVDPKTIREELRVRHMMTGSVRKSGDKVRVTSVLIDTDTEEPVWAEQWDRPVSDLFTLQDEITANIINEMEIELVEGEQRRLTQQATSNPEAYVALRRGIVAFEKLPKTAATLATAKEWFTKAIEIDPDYSAAYAWMAIGISEDVTLGFSESPDETLDEAEFWVQKAFALDDTLSLNYDTLGWINMLRGEWELAFEYQSQALKLRPGNADVLVLIGETLCVLDRADEALQYVKVGLDLNPYPPWWYWWGLGQAEMFVGNHEQALEATRKSYNMFAEYEPTHVNLVIQLMSLDMQDEAREQARKLLELNPDYRVGEADYLNSMRNDQQRADFYALLRGAGLPQAIQ